MLSQVMSNISIIISKKVLIWSRDLLRKLVCNRYVLVEHLKAVFMYKLNVVHTACTSAFDKEHLLDVWELCSVLSPETIALLRQPLELLRYTMLSLPRQCFKNSTSSSVNLYLYFFMLTSYCN